MIEIAYIESDFSVESLRNDSWDLAKPALTDTYWSGEKAPQGRWFETRLLWSDTSLYVRFDAHQGEPLIVSATPNVSSKTMSLWERDVCEIFIAPDKNEPRKYSEFEVAPTGEWIDVTIDLTSGERITGWDYASGMEAAAGIEDEKVIMAIKVPFTAFGKTPQAGEVWPGNLFRCVGTGETRGYLSWQPTGTKTPEFHHPEKFGEMIFRQKHDR